MSYTCNVRNWRHEHACLALIKFSLLCVQTAHHATSTRDRAISCSPCAFMVLAHRITDSGELTTRQSCRAPASVAEHPLAVLTTNKRCPSPHTMARARRRRENRAYTHSTRHQRWPKPCLRDGKSELSLQSCRGSLFIQLYPSSPSTAHML